MNAINGQVIFTLETTFPAAPAVRRVASTLVSTGSLLTGHVSAVFSTPLGRQITEWINQIPSDALLFFRGVLGAEYLVVTGAEGLRDVLFAGVYDFEKTSAFWRYTWRFLAGGHVVQEGHAHKTRRRIVGPVFQSRNVDLLKPLLCAKSQRLAQVLRTVCENGSNTGDDRHAPAMFAFDIAYIVGFGEDFGLIEDRGVHHILRAYTATFTGSKEKISLYALHNIAPVWMSNKFPHKLDREMDEASRVVRKITLNSVRKRMDLRQSGEKAPHDFLTEVILSEKFDAQECADKLGPKGCTAEHFAKAEMRRVVAALVAGFQ
ncbi:cytochrome P450 [Colletotrichum eremochloae]|nr:cytochrome P450 [Colletotrichum eremochloae]